MTEMIVWLIDLKEFRRGWLSVKKQAVWVSKDLANHGPALDYMVAILTLDELAQMVLWPTKLSVIEASSNSVLPCHSGI